MNITYKDCTLSDFEAVKEFMTELQQMHHKNRPDIFKGGSFFTIEDYKEELESELLFLALIDDEVAGFCSMSFKEIKDNPVIESHKMAHIEAISVREKYRKAGIGSLIFEKAKERAKALGATRLELMVWPFNEDAIGFYEHKGMKLRSYTYDTDI